jgi:hypothetical protein
MRIAGMVTCLLLLCAVESASVQAWSGDEGMTRHYDLAVKYLVDGKGYNAGIADELGENADDVFHAFLGVVVTREREAFVAELIDKVKQRSGGTAILVPITANESPVKIMGHAAYFRLYRHAHAGVAGGMASVSTVVLAQNGINVYR